VTNDWNESIWIIESYGEGIVPPGTEVGAGRTVTYTIQSQEFAPNINSLWVYVGGDWLFGTPDNVSLSGPCGTAFTYQGRGLAAARGQNANSNDSVFTVGGGAIGTSMVLPLIGLLAWRRRYQAPANSD